MGRFVFGAVVLLMAATAPVVAEESANSQPAAPATQVSLSSGIDYSSGRYGDPQSTDILVGLTSIAVTKGSFQFSASMPYLTITGPDYVVVGPGGIPVLVTRRPGANSADRSGWGDLSLSATYTLPSENLDNFDVAITGRTKVATANVSKGLSTGATDFALSVDVSKTFDIWSPFVTWGYDIPGNPAFYAFNDAPSFSVGTSVQLNDQLVAIASYDFNGSISSSLADAQQLFGSVSWLYNNSLTLTGYAEVGLSSGAPSVGTGLLISFKVL